MGLLEASTKIILKINNVVKRIHFIYKIEYDYIKWRQNNTLNTNYHADREKITVNTWRNLRVDLDRQLKFPAELILTSLTSDIILRFHSAWTWEWPGQSWRRHPRSCQRRRRERASGFGWKGRLGHGEIKGPRSSCRGRQVG